VLLPAQETLLRRAYRAFTICASAGLAWLVLEAILQYGVDVPFWDQWDLVRTLRQVSSGELSWARVLFSNIGEHRIGVELLLSLAGWQLTAMNMRCLMVLNWGIAAAFCVLAALLTRRWLPAASAIPWSLLGAASLFVFNPAAYQVWLWGLPLVHLLVPLLFLCGAAAAQSRLPESARLLAAAGCALAASFTLASGLLLWPLLCPVLACHGKPGLFRRRRAATAASAALMVFTVAACLWNPAPPPAGRAAPGAVAAFFLTYTGNLMALAADPLPVRWAQAAGLALAAFFGATALLALRHLRGRPEWPAAVLWTCLGTYSAAAGLLAAWSRAGFGVPYAIESSRYVLASCFLPLAAVALGSLLIRRLAEKLPERLHLYSWVLCATVATVLAAAGLRVMQTGRALGVMRAYAASETAGKVALAAVNSVNLREFRRIYSTDNREDFEASANYLNRARWLRPPLWDDGFTARLAALAEDPGAGALERCEGIGTALRIAGRNGPADAVIVLALAPPRLLAVAFPAGPGWSAEIPPPPPGTRLRAFAYDARTGHVQRLSGEPVVR
jgi:hypothetical protein